MSADDLPPTAGAILESVGDAVVADEGFLKRVLAGLVADGHLLIEDVPGTGKTLTARSVARATGLSFKRVQFTPDLLPADVTGSYVFNEQTREFEFRQGPVFANVVLADEINRAPPKTQSALLEAMAEGQVTVDGRTHELPEPFCVVATMNPVEHEGTFELPEAQLDRFWLKLSLGYPDAAGEVEILLQRIGRRTPMPTAETVADRDAVRELQAAAEEVTVDDDVCGYMVAIARETRTHPDVAIGVSPRGAQRLLEVSRSWAVVSGRDFVVPQDVKKVARAVLAHRVVLAPEAQVRDATERAVVRDALASVEVPTTDGATASGASEEEGEHDAGGE